MFEQLIIGFRKYAYCPKYKLIVMWSDDLDVGVSIGLKTYCYVNKCLVLIMNKSEGKFLFGKIDEADDLDEFLNRQDVQERLQEYYCIKRIKIPVPKFVVETRTLYKGQTQIIGSKIFIDSIKKKNISCL